MLILVDFYLLQGVCFFVLMMAGESCVISSKFTIFFFLYQVMQAFYLLVGNPLARILFTIYSSLIFLDVHFLLKKADYYVAAMTLITVWTGCP